METAREVKIFLLSTSLHKICLFVFKHSALYNSNRLHFYFVFGCEAAAAVSFNSCASIDNKIRQSNVFRSIIDMRRASCTRGERSGGSSSAFKGFTLCARDWNLDLAFMSCLLRFICSKSHVNVMMNVNFRIWTISDVCNAGNKFSILSHVINIKLGL